MENTTWRTHLAGINKILLIAILKLEPHEKGAKNQGAQEAKVNQRGFCRKSRAAEEGRVFQITIREALKFTEREE